MGNMKNEANELKNDGNFNGEGDNELYTVDISPTKKHIIIGGKNDAAEIYDYEEDRLVTRVENFSESVIYTKFLSGDQFIIVTADGTIALMEYEKDVYIISIEEDISVVVFNEKLVIGTLSGRVYLYNESLNHINTFGSHTTEILSVNYQEGRILSMCANFLTAHDEYGRLLYTLKAHNAYTFKYITSDVICFAREQKIQIFKEKRKLSEYAIEERVESVEFVEKSLVIGGDFDYILLIDTAGHYATFKLNIKTAVTLIKRRVDYEIVFSTVDGLIGVLDIRNVRTLKLFSPGIGILFDFCVFESKVAIVGQHGYGIVDITKDEPIDMEKWWNI